MAIQPIIDFYGQEPSLPELHDQVVIHMRKHAPRLPKDRRDGYSPSGTSNRGRAGAAKAQRDQHRAKVWAMTDEGMSAQVIAKAIGRSNGLVRRIIQEGRA